jgi:hypothetical protein
MNEHIKKGNEALAKDNLETAYAEFTMALTDPDSLTQRIAKNRLRELAPKIHQARARVMELRKISNLEEQLSPATLCHWCNSSAIFVRSRVGGFITKNCIRCQKSDYAHKEDFPLVECCGRQWTVILIDKNYHYQCGICGRTIMVADIVQRWWELFPYDPLIAPGDSGWGNWGHNGPE